MILAKLVMPIPAGSPASNGSPGSLAQSIFFETLYQGDYAYGHYLHEVNQPKPYTACIVGGMIYITIFEQQTLKTFTAGANGQATITTATTFLDLSKHRLKWVTMRFVSPTAFSRNGKPHCLPDAQSVFSSLISQWNRFSPITLPTLDYRNLLAEDVDIHIKTHPICHKGQCLSLRGFEGYVRWFCGGDTQQQKTFGALAALAEYTGLGMRTGMGMGQVRCG